MLPRSLSVIRVSLAVITAAIFLSFFFRWQAEYDKDAPIVVSAGRAEDSTYIIDGLPFDFSDGVSSDRNGKVIFRFFGVPHVGDVTGDGKEDTGVMIASADVDGETSYYVAAALLTGDGFVGTNAIMLGRGIAPQTLEIREGVIIANFATRREGDPAETPPSVGVSRYFKVEKEVLIETDMTALPSKACQLSGGTFDARHGECLGISSGQCSAIGGTFNECASACRNDPKAKACTLQCVQVCQLSK